ncbi:MAG TPA: chemotaxis protein CheW [Gallionellaceae bacterium]
MDTTMPSLGTPMRVSEWLPPADALGQFELPAGMALVAAAEERRARYGFQVAELKLLIKPGCASEVVRRPGIWSIPGAAPWLLGLLNLRSNLVPVFDLSRLLGNADARQAEERLVLVFDQGERAVGLLIDDYPRPLHDMTRLTSLPQLPAVLQSHVRGGHMKDEAAWLEFDHESFFDDLAQSAA